MERVSSWSGDALEKAAFPYDTLSIWLTPDEPMPEWLSSMRGLASLNEIYGFSKALQAMAQFYIKSVNTRSGLPRWYRNFSPGEVPDSSEIVSGASLDYPTVDSETTVDKLLLSGGFEVIHRSAGSLTSG